MEPASKRRKRGILQRQEAARSSAQEKSSLHELLMTFLAQGLLSGALCHSIAVAAKKDMDKIKEDKELPDLDQLAWPQAWQKFDQISLCKFEEIEQPSCTFSRRNSLQGCNQARVHFVAT